MVTRGWYRHYKGHAYFVHGVACLKHENDRRVAIYTSVKTEEEKRFDFLARDEADFEAWVPPEGQQRDPPFFPAPQNDNQLQYLLDHGYRPRFARITDPELSIVPAKP